MRRLPAGAPIVTAAGMRAAEVALVEAGMSQDELMERAGTLVAREVFRLAAGRPVLVLAGPGNNGGDAYVVARLLAERGLDVAVAALGAPKAGAAARMAAMWTGATSTLDEARSRPVLVDGLLGIGAPRAFDCNTGLTLDDLWRRADLRIAIDVPSGVDSDTGAGGRLADVTVALGALKSAHVLGHGGGHSGHVLLADIGIDAKSRWTTITTPELPGWRHDVNKFTRGMVVVVGGAMPGAGWLAASAALGGGAGYVVLAGREPAGGAPHALIRRTIGGAHDLADVLADARIGAVVVGPGLGRDTLAAELLDTVLACPHDLVIDGDALTLLGRDVGRRIGADRRQVCLTPHAGEFARMFDAGPNKIEATVAAAALSGAIVVHKGSDTVIGYPHGTAVVCADAPAALSAAGTGDVLAGLVAARLAGNEEASDAVATAVWLHARAAEHAGPVFTADALIGHIPAAIARCRRI